MSNPISGQTDPMIAPVPFEPLIVKKRFSQKKIAYPKIIHFFFHPHTYLTLLTQLPCSPTLSTYPCLLINISLIIFQTFFSSLPLLSLLPQRHGLPPLLLLQVSTSSRPKLGGIVGAWELKKNSKALLLCRWHAPNSLKDSNVSPKLKIAKGQGVEARSLVRSTIEG